MTSPSARAVSVALLVLTVAQLLVAVLVPGLAQFDGKNFAARLLAYPVLMLALPLTWWWVARRRRSPSPLPWAGVAWLMAPFLVDVTGNTVDLYDSIGWWDDANHLLNWLLLGVGSGLVLRRLGVGPAWVLGALVTGLGAVLAVGWELGEYVTFIRAGTELSGAYTDTLGDLALGTLGAALAGVLVARRPGAAEDDAGPALPRREDGAGGWSGYDGQCSPRR